MADPGRAGLRGVTALTRDIVALNLSRVNVLLVKQSSERYAVKVLSLQAASVKADLAFILKSGKFQHANLHYTAEPDRESCTSKSHHPECHRLRSADTHLPNQHK